MGKRNVFRFLGHSLLLASVLAALAAGYMGLAYLRDPLHLFHPTDSERFYHKVDMRMLAAGFINSYEFDSAILGTSMLQNMSAKDMGKALGGRFMNLSIRGAFFNERAVVLDHLLRQKKIKRVVCSLDQYYSNCPTNGHPDRFWTYLYDDNKWNDLKAYTDLRYLPSVFFGLPEPERVTIDRPKAWGDEPRYASRYGGLESWVRQIDEGEFSSFLKSRLPQAAAKADPSLPIQSNAAREEKSREHMEKYLLSRAESHKDTRFYLIFPPYWRYSFAVHRQTAPQDFALHQNMVRYMVRRAEELGNVEVYGFEDCAFVDDVSIYRDTVHYSQDIDPYLIESMGVGRHRLTPDNVEAYLARCEELARNFDIKALNEEAQALLAKHGK